MNLFSKKIPSLEFDAKDSFGLFLKENEPVAPLPAAGEYEQILQKIRQKTRRPLGAILQSYLRYLFPAFCTATVLFLVVSRLGHSPLPFGGGEEVGSSLEESAFFFETIGSTDELQASTDDWILLAEAVSGE